jgi:hypothetical protein
MDFGRGSIRTFKRMSAQQDDVFMGGQGGDRAFEHAMHGPTETPAEAEGHYNDFIQRNL